MSRRTNRTIVLSAASLAVFVLVAGCSESDKTKAAEASTPDETAKPPAPATASGGTAAPATVPQRSYQAAPNFSLTNVSGGTLELDSLKGKVVLLDFWATWCGPCRKAIPHLNSLYAEHKDAGLEIIGVSLDRGRGGKSGIDTVNEFAKRITLDYPIVMGNAAVNQAYGGIQSIPTAFLIDRDGKIRNRYVGLQPPHVFEKAVKELLNEKASTEEATI